MILEFFREYYFWSGSNRLVRPAIKGSAGAATSPVNPEEKEEPEETLRVTPAMEAGLTDRIWSLQELVGLLEGKEKEVAA